MISFFSTEHLQSKDLPSHFCNQIERYFPIITNLYETAFRAEGL